MIKVGYRFCLTVITECKHTKYLLLQPIILTVETLSIAI